MKLSSIHLSLFIALKSIIQSTSSSRCSAFITISRKNGHITTSTTSSTTSLLAFENEIGAVAPLGFFDPLGLVKDGNQDKFNRLRFVELKHGRISMLAVVGYLVQESGTRLPGNIDYAGTTFKSIPNGFAGLTALPSAGLLQLIGFIGFLELFVMKDVDGAGEFVGDFRNGFIDFGWDVFTPEEQERKRTIEINQGRAAMMGILALMVHEQLGVSILPTL
jgi:Chlorophyll A-B binding protein